MILSAGQKETGRTPPLHENSTYKYCTDSDVLSPTLTPTIQAGQVHAVRDCMLIDWYEVLALAQYIVGKWWQITIHGGIVMHCEA